MTGRTGLVAMALMAAVALGCFRPSVASGGFTCSDAGLCPEGFRCASSDNRCYKPDAGPETIVCQTAAPTPLCGDGPAGSDECNPTCQTGCACDRCTVANDRVTCLPAGAKKRGEVCNLQADDCEAGLGCVAEPIACGPSFGRCYKFCRDAADCDGGLACSITVAGSIKVCALAPQACLPVADTGCGNRWLGCYYWIDRDVTFCDCRGGQEESDTCGVYNDCIAGYTCVDMNGSSTCRRLCSPTGGECSGSQICRTRGAAPYGYCD